MASEEKWEGLPTIDLVKGAQQGEQDARDALFERYQGRVLKIVRIRLGARLRTSLESTDILQEAAAEALKGLNRFEMRDESSFIRWLATIVEHQITARADYHQASKRSKSREVPLQERVDTKMGESEINLADDAVVTPFSDVMKTEEQDAVQDAIAELPEKYRELIVLRDYTGASWEDVAEAVGAKSPNAARMMHSRAVARLGKTLRERGVE